MVFLFPMMKLSVNKQSVISNDDLLSAIAARQPDFVQWVGDNVDHHISILDGKKTFHVMGIIAVTIWKIMQLSYKDPQRKTEINK